MKVGVINCLLTFLLAFLLVECTIQGLYSGYNDLSGQEKKKVTDISLYTDISNISNLDSVYLITPEDLKTALQAYNRNIVYLWNPLCSNSSCVPPSLAKAEIEKRGYRFWLIATFFSNDLFNANFDAPVYGIKESVNRKRAQRYLKDFVKGLGCEDYDFELFIIFNEDSYEYMNDISRLPI